MNVANAKQTVSLTWRGNTWTWIRFGCNLLGPRRGFSPAGLIKIKPGGR